MRRTTASCGCWQARARRSYSLVKTSVLAADGRFGADASAERVLPGVPRGLRALSHAKGAIKQPDPDGCQADRQMTPVQTIIMG